MFNPDTPFHKNYSSMTCICSQCQSERNAPTAQLPRLDTPTHHDNKIWKVMRTINSETGTRHIYHWPVSR